MQIPFVTLKVAPAAGSLACHRQQLEAKPRCKGCVSLTARGEGNPSLRVLCQLAQRLGVSVVEMMGDILPGYGPEHSGASVYVLQEPQPDSLSEQEPVSSVRRSRET